MFPFELDIYDAMIQQRLAEKEETAIQQASMKEALRNRQF